MVIYFKSYYNKVIDIINFVNHFLILPQTLSVNCYYNFGLKILEDISELVLYGDLF